MTKRDSIDMESYITAIIQRLEEKIDREIAEAAVYGKEQAMVCIDDDEYPMPVRKRIPLLIEQYRKNGWTIKQEHYALYFDLTNHTPK